MKRLLERLQPLKAAVKSIFFISITVLVVIELVRLKPVSYTHLTLPTKA